MSSLSPLFFLFLFFLFIGVAMGTTLLVPAVFPTIQSAINASQPGDTVLVAPGNYNENLDFSGKKIVVASNFLLTGNVSDIEQTIINGSHPTRPDTASVVLFVHGEDSSSVLAGFTLTGGTGTVWRDIHNGSLYREGGGILSDLSSPTIKNNFIVNNEAVNLTGVTSSGGGGIRCGDGNPRILNNYITGNRGRYGAGIVLNYTGATIRNNVIYLNTGGEDYGGSGIWAYASNSNPIIIENNTITDNTSALSGGGVYIWSTAATIRNSIVWGNIAPSQSQIGRSGGGVVVTYSDIQGGYAGAGNISTDPHFSDTSHYLLPSSPCIDAGDSTSIYNDPPDTNNPANARWPAHGGSRNDMGAFGGPGSDATVYNDLHLNDPLPPSNFTAYSDYLTPASAVLHWIDPTRARNGSTISHFKIHLYRNSTFIAEVDSGVMIYTDTGLVVHQQYSYVARTVVPLDSGVTTTASCFAGGNAVPQPPSAVMAKDGEDGVHLEWINPSRQIDGTPLNDLSAILIYRDGVLLDSVIQSFPDTGQRRVYIDTATGYHWYILQTRDTEVPPNFSSRTDSSLAYGHVGTSYYDDFEQGDSHLYRTGLWDTTREIAYRSVASLTDSPHGNSPANTISYVLLPPVILRDESRLKFFHIAIVNPGSSLASVEISSDKRQTFKQLVTFNWNSYPAWSDAKADSGDWKGATLDLSSYLNDTVTLRFRMVTTLGATGDGWYIDSVSISQINPIITASYPVDSLWNLLSLPLKTTQHGWKDIYPSATSQAFTYAGSYTHIDSLLPGLGYWLKFDSTMTVQMTGRTMTHDSIPLNAGWNLIGTLSAAVDSSTISTNPAGILSSGFYEFHGQYTNTSILQPGYGYWIRAKQPGKLILRSPVSIIPQRTVISATSSRSMLGENQLVFADAVGHTQTLTFAIDNRENISLDMYDLPPIPPEGMFDIRFSTQRSRVILSQSNRQDCDINLLGIRYPVIIKWNIRDHTSESWIMVWDSTHRTIKGNGSAIFSERPGHVALRFSPGAEGNLPQNYSLEQNFPNPFNPSTTILYQLEKDGFVNLSVYNALGQKVKTLIDESQLAGYKSINFNADFLSSGLYYTRLMVTDEFGKRLFSASKKLVLVK